MKSVSISGSPRENVGKKDAKKHRSEGKVPCVLYGGKEQIHFVAEEKSFKKLVYTPDSFTVKLNLDNKEYHAILQDIQYHPVSDRILHADFLEIFEDKPVIIHIPVKVTGTAIGVLNGGRFIQKLRKLKIKALPVHLPDDVVVDISPLEINDSIKVSDIKKPNVVFLDPPSAVIVGVRVTRVIVEEVPVVAEGAVPAEGAAGATATPGAPGAPGVPVVPGAEAKDADKGKDKGKEKEKGKDKK
jgi:large subunit ribosomal protein L25